jgi:hypothetical protein
MQTFDLHLSDYDVSTRRVRVAVHRSPAGEVAAQETELPAVTLAEAVRANRTELTEMGQRLTDAVLPPPLWQAWRESVARAGDAGLCLRIHTQDPALLALPWAILRDRERRAYLSLDPQTPLVHYLPGPIARSAPVITTRLTLLHAGASPQGLEPVDFSGLVAELAALSSASDLPVLAVARAAHLQVSQLQALLQQHRPHIVHFDGHALWEPDLNQGLLVLEDDKGRPDLLPADLLATLLRSSNVRLAVLNACETAHAEQDVWAGVAQALVLAGVPAVVAMQSVVSDRQAAAFARSFYRALAQGEPVARAVVHGRQAMLAQTQISGAAGAWAIPALFLRAEDGLLWTFPAEKEKIPESKPSSGGISIGSVSAVNFVQGDAVFYQQGSTFFPNYTAQSDEKLDTLLAGQQDLKAGQAAIQQQLAQMRSTLLTHFDAGERAIVEQVASLLDQRQLSDAQAVVLAVESGAIPQAEAQALIQGMQLLLAEVADQRIVLAELHNQIQIAQFDAVLSEPRTDFRHKLKVAAPIVPFILSYEGELELSGGVNLATLWDDLVGRLKRR